LSGKFLWTAIEKRKKGVRENANHNVIEFSITFAGAELKEENSKSHGDSKKFRILREFHNNRRC
jgi:hypothetical protein